MHSTLPGEPLDFWVQGGFVRQAADGFALLAALLWGCSREHVWKDYESPDGFSALLPAGKVDDQEQNENTPLGSIHLKLHIVDAGSEGYGVGFMDVPPSFVEKVGTGKLFDLCLQGGVGNLEDGKLGKQESYKQLGYQGRKASFTCKEGDGEIRVLQVKDRTYIVMAMARDGAAARQNWHKFFDSFEFKAPGKA